MQIGFLGGTGPEAMGLALRFAVAGASVILGSRTPDRAIRAAEDYQLKCGRLLLRGMSNEDMIAACQVIFLTVPHSSVLSAVSTYQSRFTPDHILVDVTVPVAFRDGHPAYAAQTGISNAEWIAQAIPAGIPLTAAFKTIPANLLADLDAALNCDVFVCGDYEEAKAKVMALASLIPSLRPLDAGPLEAARTLERMAVLAIALNRRFRSKGARFRVEGL